MGVARRSTRKWQDSEEAGRGQRGWLGREISLGLREPSWIIDLVRCLVEHPYLVFVLVFVLVVALISVFEAFAGACVCVCVCVCVTLSVVPCRDTSSSEGGA